jgi:hypothetical protein
VEVGAFSWQQKVIVVLNDGITNRVIIKIPFFRFALVTK